ncbi:MAG: phosphate starvation-inducible protein PhoH [Betaproteobacteria bacterium]|nr:phosphate starvation-inducible protein PhoH [Betaproteobacteria bacterium]
MKATNKELRFEPADNKRLANLCGPLDANLRQLEAALDIILTRRGTRIKLTGSAENVERGASLLEQFYAQADRAIELDDVQLGVIDIRNPGLADEDAPRLMTRRRDLAGRTPNQREYLEKILAHDVTLGVGPAGTGKTYLAVACAVDALERDAVKRIVLVRPAVEAGERLGFLPGDLAQKVDPYLRPLYDALYDLMGHDKVGKMFEKGAIEIAPLAYMRGRTLNHAFIILDEAQNTTPEQMKMFLTRMGFGAKAVVTGDPTQIDLPRGNQSGLIEAMHILKDVRGIATTQFNSSDVVRHPLVGRIVEAYEAHSAKLALEGRSDVADNLLRSAHTRGPGRR